MSLLLIFDPTLHSLRGGIPQHFLVVTPFPLFRKFSIRQCLIYPFYAEAWWFDVLMIWNEVLHPTTTPHELQCLDQLPIQKEILRYQLHQLFVHVPWQSRHELNIQQHKNFVRKGNDLYYKTEISYIDSVIGKEIEIPYFGNSIKINTFLASGWLVTIAIRIKLWSFPAEHPPVLDLWAHSV